MSTVPPDTSTQTVDETEETYCYAHPKTPTKLRCSRCERPICGRCAIPASVGQHCPECVAEARRTAPKVRSTLQATAPVVMGIIIACVGIYILQRSSFEVTLRYAADPVAIQAGEWWRLITATFLHSPTMIFHIVFNMFVLYMYGTEVERTYGHLRFVVMYMIAGFGASAVSYAFGSCAGSVGASGAIFGIVGVLVVHLYNRRTTQFVRQYLNGIIGFIVINLIFGFTVSQIDNAAHIGGLVFGAALGFGFDNPAGRTSTARQVGTVIVTLSIAIALVVWRTSTFSCFGIPFN